MAEESKSAGEQMGLGSQAKMREHGFPASTEKMSVSAVAAPNTRDFTAGTHVRLASDVDCWVKFSADGTDAATNSDFPLFAKQPVMILVKAPNKRLSAIAGGSGNLWITSVEGS